MNLRDKNYVVRLTIVYDSAAAVTTALAQRCYGGGLVMDCGRGAAVGRDEAGAVQDLRDSRHAVNAVTLISRRVAS